MDSFLIGILIGIVAAASFHLAARRARAARRLAPAVRVQSFITSLRAVSELSVFRIRTKEIITASDHWLGAFGKKYLSWLLSEKQMTMIFEFDVDFRYDLMSPELHVAMDGRGTYHVTLPPSSHEVRIIDMLVHSEGKTELLPWLMPDLIGRFFTGGFSVEEKNRLIAEAKDEASRLAGDLVNAAEEDARISARRSVEMLARSFGAERVTIDFTPAAEFRPHVDATRLERALPGPKRDENRS